MLITVLALLHTAGASAICREEIPPTTPDSELWKHKNGTVVDLGTGLMWKRCSEGAMDDEECTGGGLEYTWEQALQRAKQVNEGGGYGGYTDWRLPNFKELRSIVEHACHWPAINLNRFPGTVDGASYWSSSTGSSTDRAIYVSFTDGGVNYYPKEFMLHVRLVRGGQQPAP
jgi:hypothetical protein